MASYFRKSPDQANLTDKGHHRQEFAVSFTEFYKTPFSSNTYVSRMISVSSQLYKHQKE